MKLEMSVKDAKKLSLIKKLHGLDSLEDAFVWALRNVEIGESLPDMAAFQMDLERIPRIPSGTGPQKIPDETRGRGRTGWHGIEIKLGKY